MMRKVLLTFLLLIPAICASAQINATYKIIKDSSYVITLTNNTNSYLSVAKSPDYKYDGSYERFPLYFFRFSDELKADPGLAAIDKPMADFQTIYPNTDRKFFGRWYLKQKAPAVIIVPVTYVLTGERNDKKIRREIENSKSTTIYVKCRRTADSVVTRGAGNINPKQPDNRHTPKTSTFK